MELRSIPSFDQQFALPSTFHCDATDSTRHPSPSPLLLKFSRLFVRFWYVFLSLSITFLLSTTVLSLLWLRPPDLRDPSSDFVPIGTAWSAIVEQYNALLAATSDRPSSLILNLMSTSKASFSRARKTRSITTAAAYPDFDLCLGYSENPVNLWSVYSNFGRIVVSLNQKISNHSQHVDFFSNTDAFLSLCELQSRISQLSNYKKECLYTSLESSETMRCCPMWSLPNMLQVLAEVDSCTSLLPRLEELRHLLLSCLPAFHQGTLRRSCWDLHGTNPRLLCPFVHPSECLMSPVIPLILATSLPDNTSDRHSWSSTLLQLPLRRANALTFYKELESAYKSGNLTLRLPARLNLQGMYLHAYDDLVSEFLVLDAYRLLFGLFAMLLLLVLCTRSLSLPLVASFGIVWSILAAYTFYTHVLSIEHFPVINFMAVVLVLGLGMDDLLVYYQVWTAFEQVSSVRHFVNLKHLSSTENAESDALAIRLYYTLLLAVPSIIMTSIATVIGLSVNFLSSVVAVQRFSLFAIACVLFNLLYVLIMAPIFYVSVSKYRSPVNCRCRFSLTCLSSKISKFFIWTRYLNFLAFIILAAFSVHQLALQRRLSPSTSTRSASFFSRTHPFEIFLNEQYHLFWAERNLHHQSHSVFVHFVWGIQPADDRTLLSYTKSSTPPKFLVQTKLNFTSKAARNWLSWFCDSKMRQVPYLLLSDDTRVSFYLNALPSFHLSNMNPFFHSPVLCPLGRFSGSLNDYVLVKACLLRNSFCCPNRVPLNITSVSSWEFSRCLQEYLRKIDSRSNAVSPFGYRFMFDENHEEPVGFIVSFLTNVSLVNMTPYDQKQFVSVITSWFEDSIRTAPGSIGIGQVVIPTLRSAHVTLSIIDYIHWSVLCAVALAASLVLVTSRSLLLSLLSFCSLVGCLLLTVTFVTMVDGWELGLVEGLVISLAAGLAIDPCLHFVSSISRISKVKSCVNHFSPSLEQIEHVLCLLTPAITWSTWTTALAGFCMIGSNLLFLHQLGFFLATLMLTSWLFCYVFLATNVACISSVTSWFRSFSR